MSSLAHKTRGAVRLLLTAAALLVAVPHTAAQRPSIRGTASTPTLGANTSGQQSGQQSGQYNPFGLTDSTAADSAVVRGLEYNTEVPDSVLQRKVARFLYSPMQPKILTFTHPSLDPTGAQHVDPLDGLDGNYYLSKGIVGQPHTALYPTPAADIRPRMTPQLYEGYAKSLYNVGFFQTLTPYSVLSYQASLDDDYQLRIAHTQNLRPGWNASFDYRLANPDGVYTNSNVKNHYLDATTNYFSSDARLRLMGAVVWNAYNMGENGGLADDAYFTERLQANLAGVPVRLDNASTRFRSIAAMAHASYNLVRQFPSVRERDSLAARADDSLHRVDTLTLFDTLAAPRPRAVNPGVIGLDLRYERQKRTFDSTTVSHVGEADLFWTNDAYMDHRWRNPLKIAVGLRPRVLVLDVAHADTLWSTAWLNPYASAELALGRASLALKAENAAAFGLERDYHYQARLHLPLDSAATSAVTLLAAAQRACPEAQLIFDARRNQGFTPASVTSQRFELDARFRQVADLQLRASHMSHNVWYDTSLLVVEGQGDFWLFQADATLRLHAGPVHLDMQQLLQYATDTLQMPVPLLASKNSLYVDLNLFGRALRTQVGADLRYHSPFLAPAYAPAAGAFVHQQTERIGGYLWADLFVNLQIKRATIVLKAGHLNALWDQSPSYFLLPHYPGRDFGLFWGLTWHFFD